MPTDAPRPAPPTGEPLLTCFDCHRAMTYGQLTLFPWWDEHRHGFDAMYRCARCLPKARKQVLKQLMKNEEMFSNFVDFASQKVFTKELVPLRYDQGTKAMDYARHVLDALVAHEASILLRRLGQ